MDFIGKSTCLVVVMFGVFIAGSVYQQNGDISWKTIPAQEIVRTVSKVPEVERVSKVPEVEGWEVTGYCPCEKCCGVWATRGVNTEGSRVTSSQHVIKYGTKLIAAPKKYAFGTKMNIDGYGTWTVEDRGGKIQGNKLDVLFFEKSPDHRTDLEYSHQLALSWGRRKNVAVEVY